MPYWMVKQEPTSYSWDDFVREGKTSWTGVRNYQARNYLSQMKKGESVLFYHSGAQKSFVGTAQVVREGYRDPSTDDDRWVAVDLKPKKALKNPVALDAVKKEKSLGNLMLFKNSRLSVLPLTKEEFEKIVSIGSAE